MSTDIAVFLYHCIEITNISYFPLKIKSYDWQTERGKVKEEWKFSVMVTGEQYAMINGTSMMQMWYAKC